jgi:hypothetical protein
MTSKYLYADSDEIEIVIQKANPYKDPATGRFTTGGGGGAVTDGSSAVKAFEAKVDEAYGIGTEDEFTINHTGDESVAALGHYLGTGHVVNDRIRKNDFSVEDPTKPYVETPNVTGLDNAIEMAPPMPNQTVWRTTSAEAVERLAVGSTYQDRGYTSTTALDITHPDNGLQLLTLSTVSSGRKTIMEIDTGDTGKGLYMPKMFPGQPTAEFEKEFLMPRGVKMTYLGAEPRFVSKSPRPLTVHKFKVVG